MTEKIKGFTDEMLTILVNIGAISLADMKPYNRDRPRNHFSYHSVNAKDFLEKLVPLIPDSDLDDYQNYSPSIKEIIDGCERGTILGVGGYIINKERADERLSIDTIYIPETIDDAISGNARGADEVYYAELDGRNVLGCWYD